MKRNLMTLCVALMTVFLLCGSALAAGDVTNNATLKIDFSKETAENMLEGKTDLYEFDFILKNPTSKQDHTLMALILYGPDEVFDSMYQTKTSAAPFRFTFGGAYFFDITLAPGEEQRIPQKDLIATLDSPYFVLNFDSEAEMENFKGEIDFEEAYTLDDEGPDCIMSKTESNAELIYRLEKETNTRTDVISIDDLYGFLDGYSLVQYRDGSYGYIDIDGNIKVPPCEYIAAGPFSDGKAVVCRYNDSDKNYDNYGEMGIIDTQGNYTPFEEQEYIDAQNAMWNAPYFNEGYVHLQWAGDYPGALFDGNGKMVVENACGPVKDGTVLSSSDPDEWNEEQKYGWGYSTDLTLNIPGGSALFTASEAKPMKAGQWDVYNINPFDDGLAWAKVLNNTAGLKDGDDRVGGFIDKSGKMVIAPQYQGIWVADAESSFQVFNHGVACVRNTSGKWGGIDTKGNTVIPFQYDTGFRFGGDGQLARITVNGKAGYMNQQGHMVIPAIYDVSGSASCSSNGLVMVSKGGKTGYVDVTGKVVIPLEYDGGTFFRTEDAFVLKGCVFTQIKNPLK